MPAIFAWEWFYVMRLLGLIGKKKVENFLSKDVEVSVRIITVFQPWKWKRTRPPCFTFTVVCVSGEWTGFDIFFRVYGCPLCVFCISNTDCLIYSNWTSHWISQDNEKTIKASNYFLLLGGLQSWFTASTGTINWYAHVAVWMITLLFYSPVFTFYFRLFKTEK